MFGVDWEGSGLRRTVADYTTWVSDAARAGKDGHDQEEFVAFTCSSWLLDPHYCDVLHAGSNIVQFQRECYCYPTGAEGDGHAGYDRIFAPGEVRKGTGPRPSDSSLQSGFLKHVQSGGRWVGGGCILLAEHIDRYGTQVYSGFK